MDIDLRLPSGEYNDDPHVTSNMLDNEQKLHSGDLEVTQVLDVRVEVPGQDNGVVNSPIADLGGFKEDLRLEPLFGMEFDSHGEAYSYYQEYARSTGFNTAIQNSRRSKTSREFIDAKFACSRYGTKREYDKSYNRQRARQNNPDAEHTTGRRACTKTDCKASMHVKRRPDGKWIIHTFVKDHNHDLLPAQAVSEQTRKMYAAMARQFAEYKNVIGLTNDTKSPFDKNRNLAPEAGDLKILLEFFTQMKSMNPNFFYAVDVGEDQRLKNLFWVDGKSRHDYVNFSDVVSFDITYIRNKYKMPLALFVGVNHHYQFMLLGCALISDETPATFSWLMQTWLKSMGGLSPKVLITDQDRAMKSVISEVFPYARHCFFLWHVLGKVSENLGHVIKQHQNFMEKFEKCIYMSWNDEEFGIRWWKILDRFGLKENEVVQSLYEDRGRWVPVYLTDVFLGGMCTAQRSDSINSFFDKYVHRKTNVPEFVKQYETILQDRYEEEAKADNDTWNKQLGVKSPSPFEKSVTGVYTHALLKKFQAELLGSIACCPKRENHDGLSITFRVQDIEKKQDFVVIWNETKTQVSCSCRLFEYKGYLCRHALIVLQFCHLSVIPPQYVLKRWTKDAKNKHFPGEEPEQINTRLERYNGLSQRAMKLIEEASMSQDAYLFAFRAIEDALENCENLNTNKNSSDAIATQAHGLLSIEEDDLSRNMGKTSKKKNPTKKRKMNSEQEVMSVGAPDSMQQMDKLSPRPVALDRYHNTQQSVQGMVQLNLMAPNHEMFYGSQQTIQGLGQLNSIAPSHDNYFSAQQSMHGLGQMDFFRQPTGYSYNIRQEEPNVRTAQQLHDDGTRHA